MAGKTRNVRTGVRTLAVSAVAVVIAVALSGCMVERELTRDAMNRKLRALNRSVVPVIESPGAMCYDTSAPMPVAFVCDECGQSTEVDGWLFESIQTIKASVAEMNDEGFDVTLDLREFCPRCSKDVLDASAGLASGDPQVVFGIRFAGDDAYHYARSNNPSDYTIVGAFLKGDRTWTDAYGGVSALKKEYQVIEKMTGLSMD